MATLSAFAPSPAATLSSLPDGSPEALRAGWQRSLGDLRIFSGFNWNGKCDSSGSKPQRTEVLWLSHGTFRDLLRKPGQVSKRSESEHRRCVIPANLRAAEGPIREFHNFSGSELTAQGLLISDPPLLLYASQ